MTRIVRTTSRPAFWLSAWSLSLVVVAAAAFHLATSQAEARFAEKQKEHFFELRVYTTAEGKLDDLHKRFRDHTNDLFKKHGMELVGFWTPTEEPDSENTLIYILSHKSREARDASFRAFRNDPEWKRVYSESRKDGPIVVKVQSTFMEPTDYSPIK